MNVANLVTLLRFPLLIVIVLLLYMGNVLGQLISAVLTILLIVMDSLDGMFARQRGEATLIGGALDIAADRAVEIVLWVVYAHLGLISVIVPLIVVIRGALTDSIRNVALQHGYSAHDMMRSRWGRWLVASNLVRTVYAVIKAVAFTLLAVTLGLKTGGYSLWHVVEALALVFTWLSVVLCLARGMPVLIEAPRLFRTNEFQPAPPTVALERLDEPGTKA